MLAASRIGRTVAAAGIFLSLAAHGPAGAQDVGHVAIIRLPAASYAPEDWNTRAAAARAFFASHADGYDFLVVFPAVPVEIGAAEGAETLGRHYGVRNAVSGIGVAPFDGGGQTGSPGRLKGYVDVYSLVPGLAQAGFDAALATTAHEIAHQWSGKVGFRDPATGSRSGAILGADGAHWSFYLDSDASVLYGSDWRDAGGGTFVADASMRRYSALDLYLMGFRDPAEVPDFALLQPAGTPPHPAEAPPPPNGTSVAATARTISVADVVAAEGPRAPSVAGSQRTFRAAFAIAVAPGQEPTAEQVAFVDAVRREWANRFFFMTGGDGVMETDLVEAAGRPVASSPSVRFGLEYLIATQGASGAWDAAMGMGLRSTAEAISALALFRGDPAADGARLPAAAWLGTQLPQDVDSASRRAVALAGAGDALSAEAPFDASQANLDGGLGLVPGYRSNVVDSALAGLARSAAGRPADDVDAVAAYLVAVQNGDGGWPALPGGASTIETTSWALRVLARATRHAEVLLSAGTGIAFLNGHRTLAGGFGEHGPAGTAEAVLALGEWNALSPGDAAAAAEELLANQLADGSWNASAHDTAVVLRALRSLLAPNVAIDADSVVVAPASPSEGEPVQVRLRLENLGRAAAGPVVVRAFDSQGNPFAPDAVVALAPGGGFADVSLVIDTTGRAGSTQLFLVADPDGTLDQITREDDRVAVPLPIGPRPAQADLIVFAHTVASDPPHIVRLPAALAVTGTIANLGLTDAPGAEVALLLDGAVLATQVVDLPAGVAAPVSIVGVVPSVSASARLVLVVNRDGRIAEARLDNNQALLEVPLVPSVDLAVAGLEVSPAVVDQGQDLAIRFSVPNSGTVDAPGAQVCAARQLMSA
jgi:hypothetical protein